MKANRRVLTFAPRRRLNADGFESYIDQMRRVFVQLPLAQQRSILDVTRAALDAHQARCERERTEGRAQ
jgi:hypothetical protein